MPSPTNPAPCDAEPQDEHFIAAQGLIREVQVKLAQDAFFLAAAQQWIDALKIFRILQVKYGEPPMGSISAYHTLILAFRTTGQILKVRLTPEEIKDKLGLPYNVFEAAVDELTAEDYSNIRCMSLGEANALLVKSGLA